MAGFQYNFYELEQLLKYRKFDSNASKCCQIAKF